MATVLDVQDLHFAYPGRPVLRGVSLQVKPGESAFLLGPSGCGKSTLLRCIAGLEQPTGRIALDGADITNVPTHRRGIGMMFQAPALFPHMDVAHNVAFGLRYRGVAKRDRTPEAHHWLDMVGLADRAADHIDDLSGGQRQRVALARALAAKPRAILLDEPFSSLDRALRDRLGDHVKRLLADQGVPALWVTHDADEAHRLGDTVHQMVDGQLC